MTRERALELLAKPDALLELSTAVGGWGKCACDAERFASIESALDAGVELPPIGLVDRGVNVSPRWTLGDGRHRLYIARKRKLPGLWVMFWPQGAIDLSEGRGPIWMPLGALAHINPGIEGAGAV